MKVLVRKLLNVFLYGIISSIIAFLVSLMVAKLSGASIYSIMGGIGIAVSLAGALSLGHGNPTPSYGTESIGQGNQAYTNYLNMEITKNEREITDYNKSTKNHPLFYFRAGGLNVLLNGIIIFLISILLNNIK